MSDYLKYRGKCKELAESAVKENPNLILVRGYYYDYLWGKQQHWWTKDQNNEIYDPSANQFPSKGYGEYQEFCGYFHCEICGDKVFEPIKYAIGSSIYCSGTCYGKAIL